MTRRQGFTLLEILVAAILVAILAGAIVALLDSAQRARTLVDSRSERRILAGALLDVVALDLTGALATGTTQDPGFLGNDDSAGDLAIDSLSFLTLSGRPDRRSAQPSADFRQVGYRLETDTEAEAPGLVREELTLITGTSLFGEDLHVVDGLSEDVGELDFEYFDGSSWQTEWDSNVNEGLPAAVRVQIAFLEDETRWGRVVALRIDRDFQAQTATEGE